MSSSSPSEIRIACLVSSLRGGGAEKVICQLANEFACTEEAVTLITLDSVEQDQYTCSSAVQRVGLNLMSESKSLWQAVKSNLARLRELKKQLDEFNPTVVLSFQTEMNVLACLACRAASERRLIISERTHPLVHPLPRIWKILRRFTYQYADQLVVQTEAVQKMASKWMPQEKIEVIPNGVEITGQLVEPQSIEPTQDVPQWFVSTMRLSHEKGPDLLLNAFAKIANKVPTWNLKIIGEGPLRTELESRVQELHLEQRVEFTGWKADPISELMVTQLYVLPSRYEGFPNSLLEAMAVGLPAIAFDCEFGPADLIEQNVNGLLVPALDEERLAAAMETLAMDRSRREELGQAAYESVQKYKQQQVVEAWKKVIHRCN